MVCIVKYNWNKQELTFKVFSNEENAFKWVDKISGDTSYSEVEVLVSYANVAIYIEKFELLFQRLLDQADGVKNQNVIKKELEKELENRREF